MLKVLRSELYSMLGVVEGSGLKIWLLAVGGVKVSMDFVPWPANEIVSLSTPAR